MIKNKLIFGTIASFLLASFAFGTPAEEENFAELYHATANLNLSQSINLERALRNLLAMRILGPRILADNAAIETREGVRRALGRIERLIQRAGGNPNSAQQVAISGTGSMATVTNWLGGTQVLDMTVQPTEGTYPNSMASGVTGMSVFTSLTDRAPVTTADALRPQEVSQEDLLNRAILDEREYRDDLRAEFQDVVRFLRGEDQPNQGAPLDYEALVEWAEARLNEFTEGVPRRARNRNPTVPQYTAFSDRNRIMTLRFEYLNRYFMSLAGGQDPARAVRALADRLRTNPEITRAVLAAMPRQSGQRRQRGPEVSQAGTVTPAERAQHPNIAVRADGTRTQVQAIENAGGGECLYLSLGTTRQALLAGIRANRHTDQRIHNIFVQSVQTGGPDYNAWQRGMGNGPGRRLGDLLDAELWAAFTMTPVRIFRLDQRTNTWAEVQLLNPANGQGPERWIGNTGGHWVELQPGNQAGATIVQSSAQLSNQPTSLTMTLGGAFSSLTGMFRSGSFLFPF